MFRPPGAFGVAPPPPPPQQQQQHQPWQWQPPFQPPAATSFWQRDNVREHVGRLQETIELATAVINELEEIAQARNSVDASTQGPDSSSAKLSSEPDGSSADRPRHFVELARAMKISQDTHESLATDAANYLCSQIQNLLAPIYPAVNQRGPWEERSAMIRLAQKLQKSKRNKRWRKRERKHVAELFQKEHADYDRIDQEADEWRARQIAKDMAQRKVENMKQIAKKKANEERKRLESELELALMVEKLQELRSMRVQKMKKQGHFLPEEDDKYLERVKAAVEEEERQAASAARTDAAKDAILTAEESRKAVQCSNSREDDSDQAKSAPTLEQNQRDPGISGRNHHASQKTEHELHKDDSKGHGHYDSVSSLPFEFYHYYHGSSYDMGTLIEVRRMWDSFIRAGGSRIPGHWVQPPPPADEVWASYLVQPNCPSNST
ncbi:hypothetical protein OsI_00976 [Oryza sativa Indica Group]|uniref:Uncharacterized protein n=1 Tax=Oryza sativa subsp. indica TaxID=39946 RepID=B8AAY7_ORYSI|nr:hypothetical protein OsI_00976 [Oryza sativa Indica Group]